MFAPKVAGSVARFALGTVGFDLLMFAYVCKMPFFLGKYKSKDSMEGAVRDSMA